MHDGHDKSICLSGGTWDARGMIRNVTVGGRIPKQSSPDFLGPKLQPHGTMISLLSLIKYKQSHFQFTA